jgi:hypothetical protein
LGGLYISVFVIYLIAILIQLIQLQKTKLAANYSNCSNWESILASLPIKNLQIIKIGTSEQVQSPIVFGWLEPIILLPISYCNQLNTEEIRFILLHEIAHIIRNDFLINIIGSMAKTILWFNPFAHFMHKEINLQREIACDCFVMNYDNNPLAYSKALYQIADRQFGSRLPMSLAAVDTKNELLYRIQLLNQIKPKINLKLQIGFLLGPILIAGFLLSSLHPMPSNTQLNHHYISNITLDNVSSNVEIVKVKTALNPATSKIVAHRHSNKPKVEHQSINEINNITTTPSSFFEDNAGIAYNYDQLLEQTKEWIALHQNPLQFANFDYAKDSVTTEIAERLLINSIIKSYQLKKAIMAQKLDKANEPKEAIDYLLNSKEWEEMIQYEKWAHEFLLRHQ